MIPLFIQGWEWLILLAIALLIFGGTKLAGIGKGAGQAVREFKEETRKKEVDHKTDEPGVDDTDPRTHND